MTQKLMWDLLVRSQGLLVYQVRISPVERIGRSLSKIGSRHYAGVWTQIRAIDEPFYRGARLKPAEAGIRGVAVPWVEAHG